MWGKNKGTRDIINEMEWGLILGPKSKAFYSLISRGSFSMLITDILEALTVVFELVFRGSFLRLATTLEVLILVFYYIFFFPRPADCIVVIRSGNAFDSI